MRRHHLVSIAALSLTVALTGCSADSDTDSTGQDSATQTLGHVHGLATDPGTDTLLVATHEGLYELTSTGKLDKVGPVIDLMGFAVAGPDHYFASGHPGPGVDMPQPVGLIESTDGGRTWTPLSRQGQSDFHALTVSQAGVVGYDGSLVTTADQQTWETLPIPAAPASIAASDHGQQLLATTEQGLLRSADAGQSWDPVPDAPLLQVVDWSTGLATVGISPAGDVWTSDDGGLTWRAGAELGAAPQAVDLTVNGDQVTITAMVGNQLVGLLMAGRRSPASPSPNSRQVAVIVSASPRRW